MSNRFTARPKILATKEKPATLDFSLRECGQKAAHVCAICEEGEDLFFCDGPCMRHFHRSHVSKGATLFSCPGLVAPVVPTGSWHCPDCQLKQAMCFSCSLVGNFQGVNGRRPLVCQCPNPLCIRFFCFTCLPAEKTSCGVHTCREYYEPDSKSVAGMVHCLMCPTAWHLRCLKEKQANGYCGDREIYQHTWSGHVRHMFYCHKHNIDPHLGTPVQNHVIVAIKLTGGHD